MPILNKFLDLNSVQIRSQFCNIQIVYYCWEFVRKCMKRVENFGLRIACTAKYYYITWVILDLFQSNKDWNLTKYNTYVGKNTTWKLDRWFSSWYFTKNEQHLWKPQSPNERNAQFSNPCDIAKVIKFCAHVTIKDGLLIKTPPYLKYNVCCGKLICYI